MKVGELREILNGMSDDMDIIITSTDPTDYTYINKIEGIKNGHLVNYGDSETFIRYEELDESDLEDVEEGIMFVESVVVIDGGLC
tara:strand:+ start:288 stop:542 length:255 start_codon:yes stop_codon:yes gene_type:complete